MSSFTFNPEWTCKEAVQLLVIMSGDRYMEPEEVARELKAKCGTAHLRTTANLTEVVGDACVLFEAAQQAGVLTQEEILRVFNKTQ